MLINGKARQSRGTKHKWDTQRKKLAVLQKHTHTHICTVLHLICAPTCKIPVCFLAGFEKIDKEEEKRRTRQCLCELSSRKMMLPPECSSRTYPQFTMTGCTISVYQYPRSWVERKRLPPTKMTSVYVSARVFDNMTQITLIMINGTSTFKKILSGAANL